VTVGPRQFVLDLAHRPALGAEDFLVSGSNASAVDFIDRWPEWPLPAAILVGPPRSGKTHLAHVWRRRSGASAVAAEALGEAAIGALKGGGSLVVEDIHAGIADERTLFHALNLSRESRLFLLLTSRRPPGEIDAALPDLRSRLRALPVLAIAEPDDSLFRAVLVKLFADRQLAVEPHIIDHIALRMERSMAAAAGLVAEIDRRALASHRKVTRALAAEALAASAERAATAL
jgi:chromosomal replication initiation ATPase DnaA